MSVCAKCGEYFSVSKQTAFCPKCETTNQELTLDMQGKIGKSYGSLEPHFTNLEITKCDKITLTLDSVDISVELPTGHFDHIKKIIINGNEFVRKEQK